MGKLERLAPGREEKPWPRSLIEKDELEKWQKYFCDISNVFLCAVDERGVPLTALGGSPEEAEQVERLIDGDQFQNMLQRVAESELEDRAVERTAYPNFRLAVVTSKVERRPVVNWLICGIMDDTEDAGEYENPPLQGFSSILSEKQFLRVVDTLKSITDAMLTDRRFLRQAQSKQQKSAHLEQTAEEKLRSSEFLREMMWLLGSSEPPKEAARKLLQKTAEHLQLDMTAIYCRALGKQPQMTVKWSKKDISWGFESDSKLSWPSLLTPERNLILSSNTMLGEEEKEEMDALGLKALMTMPIKRCHASGDSSLMKTGAEQEEYWVCFGMSEKERVWELEEIRFLGEAVRILQGILARQEASAASGRRSTSNANKRKKK